MWKRRRQPMSDKQFLQLCKTDFSAALKLNKLWRGDLIPNLPITKNIFCLNDRIYDIEKLKQDLECVVSNTETGWEDKGKGAEFLNIWKSITLKGYQGKIQPFLETHNLVENSVNPYKYTDNMKHCNYIREILTEIEKNGSEVYLVRLLSLVPGKWVGFHTDNSVFKDKMNIIRCHIPIVTDPKCKMFLGYPTSYFPKLIQTNKYKANPFFNCHLDAGRLWYTNVNCLHAVENKSDIVRVHLVVDIKPTKEMLQNIYGKFS
jgi:hypothetical protein